MSSSASLVAENGHVTSFSLRADVLLEIWTLFFMIDADLYIKCCIIVLITQHHMCSHGVHSVNCAVHDQFCLHEYCT